jgi:hypothetical protein
MAYGVRPPKHDVRRKIVCESCVLPSDARLGRALLPEQPCARCKAARAITVVQEPRVAKAI